MQSSKWHLQTFQDSFVFIFILLTCMHTQEEATNKAKKDRENLGVELYGIQQDLAKQQMILEKHQDEHADLNQDRTQAEDNLREMRQMYREKQTGLGNERKQGKHAWRLL